MLGEPRPAPIGGQCPQQRSPSRAASLSLVPVRAGGPAACRLHLAPASHWRGAYGPTLARGRAVVGGKGRLIFLYSLLAHKRLADALTPGKGHQIRSGSQAIIVMAHVTIQQIAHTHHPSSYHRRGEHCQQLLAVQSQHLRGAGEHHAREVELVHDPPFLPCLTCRNLLAFQQCTSKFLPGDSVAHKVSCFVVLQPSLPWTG
jgi:hypothetical protein